ARRRNWMDVIGRNSLMVYWVHLMLVYSDLFKPWKAHLSIPQTTVATVVVVLLMVGLSVAWQRWKPVRATKGSAVYAGGSAGEPISPSGYTRPRARAVRPHA